MEIISAANLGIIMIIMIIIIFQPTGFVLAGTILIKNNVNSNNNNQHCLFSITLDKEFALFLATTDRLCFYSSDVTIQCFNSVLLRDSFCIVCLDQ